MDGGKLRRNLTSSVAFSLRLSYKLGYEFATPKLKQVLQDLVEDAAQKKAKRIDLFEALQLQKSNDVPCSSSSRGKQTCDAQTLEGKLSDCHVGTQTSEELISEKQCKSLVLQYEVALQTVSDQLRDLQLRLQVQEQESSGKGTTPGAASTPEYFTASARPTRSQSGDMLHSSVSQQSTPFPRQTENVCPSTPLEDLRAKHKAERLALLVERRRVRASCPQPNG